MKLILEAKKITWGVFDRHIHFGWDWTSYTEINIYFMLSRCVFKVDSAQMFIFSLTQIKCELIIYSKVIWKQKKNGLTMGFQIK